MKLLTVGLIASVVLMIAGCNNNSGSEESTTTSTDSSDNVNTPVTVDSTISGCYSLMGNRDTSSLQLQVKGTHATGSLSYNNFEKDRNDGTFEGDIEDGILTGWYLFRSEGIMSVRQVAWKIGQDKLLPAQGEVTVRNDTAMFKDLGRLQFDSSRVYVKTPCVL